MTVRKTASLAALVIALATGTRAWAQGTEQPISLTLDEAIARASSASNRIAESRARGTGAEAVVGERHAPTLPQLSLLGGYTRTNHVQEFGIPLPNNRIGIIYPDVPDNYRSRLDVQWPVYTAGRLNALESAARHDSSAAARDVDTTATDVRLDVTRAFWALLTAREALRVVRESLGSMSEHVRDVGNQLNAGLVPPNDLLSAQAQEARERMLAVEAQTAQEVAAADLARLIGAAPGTAITPVATLNLPVVSGTLDDLVAQGRERRPDRQALTDRLSAAQERVRAASAGLRPTIGVAGGVDYARPNPRIFPRVAEWKDSWDASVNVSWPILDGGKTHSETAEATAAVQAAQARLAEFDSLLALDVRQRLSELESSKAALEAADVAVQAATEARRVVGQRFNAGVATSTDVVDAQVAILQAELDRTRAIASARLAEARLNHAVGR
jgi:outer membrane protein TolC